MRIFFLLLHITFTTDMMYGLCFLGFKCPEFPENGETKLLFPQDFGAHDNYRLEWWYYTGNLVSTEDKPYGFQLTLVRLGILPFHSTQAYMAHLAITAPDIGKGFYFGKHTSLKQRDLVFKVNPMQIGFTKNKELFFSANGQTGEIGTSYFLQGNSKDCSTANDLQVNIHATDEKGIALQGYLGYSRKGENACSASNYFSQTHLKVDSSKDNFLKIGSKIIPITKGKVWMDHEYSTPSLENLSSSWDWFNVKLENDSELMFFNLRDRHTGVLKIASGTFIDPQGQTHLLSEDEFEIIPQGKVWVSPKTNIAYPISWLVNMTSIGLKLEIEAIQPNQELAFDLNSFWTFLKYWEGATKVLAKDKDEKVIKGVGYTELFGYSRSSGKKKL